VVGKNVITRALGVRETVEVDYRLVRIRPGDIFILCSDGLCGFADDDEIFEVANKTRNDIKRIVNDLVQFANDRGGSDNVTVLALQIEEVDTSTLPEVEVFTLPAESEEILAVEDAWFEKITQFEEESNSDSEENLDESSHGKLFLTLIFIVFIVVAGAIIYFTTYGK
jgi:serine/threonine protein phosphatase PrpC